MNLLPLAAALAAALVVLIGFYGLHLTLSRTRVRLEDAADRPAVKSDDTFFLYKITEAIGRPFAGSVLASLSDKRRRSIAERTSGSG